MSWIGVGVAAVGTAVNMYGQDQAAKGAARGAKAQFDMASAMRAQTVDEAQASADRIRQLAEASPMELAQQAQGLGAIQTQLRSQQAYLSAIDPTILEASQQALKLLRGDQASSVGPLMNQRDQMRQQLVNNLRSRLGTGAETSSFGQKQLQAFDMQTNQLMNQAQQGQLQGLTGMLTNLNGSRPDIAGTASAGQNLAGYFQNRKISTEQSAGGMVVNAMNGTAAPLIENAGYVGLGQQLAGRQTSQIGGMIGSMGSMYAGSTMSKPANAGSQDASTPVWRDFDYGDSQAASGTSKRNGMFPTNF